MPPDQWPDRLPPDFDQDTGDPLAQARIGYGLTPPPGTFTRPWWLTLPPPGERLVVFCSLLALLMSIAAFIITILSR